MSCVCKKLTHCDSCVEISKVLPYYIRNDMAALQCLKGFAHMVVNATQIHHMMLLFFFSAKQKQEKDSWTQPLPVLELYGNTVTKQLKRLKFKTGSALVSCNLPDRCGYSNWRSYLVFAHIDKNGMSTRLLNLRACPSGISPGDADL